MRTRIQILKNEKQNENGNPDEKIKPEENREGNENEK